MDKSEQVDPEFLKNEAYDDGGDLKTRIQIQEEHATHPEDWFRWLFDQFEFPPSSRMLELGCGTGDLWLKNMDRLSKGWEAILSDFALGMLNEPRRSSIAQDSRIKFCVLDAQAIPFPESSFDAVIGNGLVDHLPNRKRAIDEIQRVLKPGGKFYTSAGGRTHLKEFNELIRPFLPEKDFGGEPERFGLENGEAILAHWFPHVRRTNYHSVLEFYRPDPILDYIFSEGDVKGELGGDDLASFKSFLEERFASHGVIRVTLEKGVFEAVKA
jgi:SAM-dependent methyltransferase